MTVRSLGLPWGIAQGRYGDCRTRDAVSDPNATLDLEAIYRIRRPEIIRYLIHFHVDMVEAEDIAQEVFLQLLNPATSHKQPDNLIHWALVCARNLAIDRHRRGRRELLAPASLWKQWEETLPDGAAGAEACMDEKDGRLRLARAIRQLSPLEQRCLILRSRGVSFREMAAALETSMQTAVYTTDVAIQKLQRKLKCTKQLGEVS